MLGVSWSSNPAKLNETIARGASARTGAKLGAKSRYNSMHPMQLGERKASEEALEFIDIMLSVVLSYKWYSIISSESERIRSLTSVTRVRLPLGSPNKSGHYDTEVVLHVLREVVRIEGPALPNRQPP